MSDQQDCKNVNLDQLNISSSGGQNVQNNFTRSLLHVILNWLCSLNSKHQWTLQKSLWTTNITLTSLARMELMVCTWGIRKLDGNIPVIVVQSQNILGKSKPSAINGSPTFYETSASCYYLFVRSHFKHLLFLCFS